MPIASTGTGALPAYGQLISQVSPVREPAFWLVFLPFSYALLIYSPPLTSNRKACSAPTGCSRIGIVNLKGLSDQVVDKVDF